MPQLPPQAFGFRHVDTLIPLSSAGKVKPSFSCWHALTTYLSLIDPALKVDAACAAGAAVASSAKLTNVNNLSLNTGLGDAPSPPATKKAAAKKKPAGKPKKSRPSKKK